MASMPNSNCCVTLGTWFDPGQQKTRDDAIAALAQCGVVLLGETHDDAEHHRWQQNTIAALFGLRRDLVLGFEMFPRRVQPVLDRWSEGELSEVVFLEEVDWPRIWGIDAGLYLPLFHFARMHRLPMLALNVDRETNRRVAASGFAAVPSGDRENIGEPAPASKFYRERLFEWFKHHPSAGTVASIDSEKFERFVRAQLFWDRAMAEAIAGTRKVGQGPVVIGVVGSGHIEYGDGIPRQLAALGVGHIATALPWRAGTECPAHDPQIADLLFGVAPP
jgi:uncharacterized iron-regulated protein